MDSRSHFSDFTWPHMVYVTWTDEFNFRLTKYRRIRIYPTTSKSIFGLEMTNGTKVETYSRKCDPKWSLTDAKRQFILEF